MARGALTRRLVLVGALTAGLVAGGGVAWAFWGAQGAAPGPAVESGRLDLTVVGASGTLAGPGGTAALSALTLPNAVPGQAVSATVTVHNAGDTPFVATATATRTGTLGASTTTPVSFQGTGTGCTGGTGATSPVVPPGGDVTLCVGVGVAAGAPAADQGKSGSITVALSAAQVRP